MDIVERLNNSDAPYYESSLRINRKLERDIEEAAAEIERMRKAVRPLKKENKALKVEIERLRDALRSISCTDENCSARAALGEEK